MHLNLRRNRQGKNERQKRILRDILFYFQNYLRDTGIDFEFIFSPAHTQIFENKIQGRNDFTLITRKRGYFFIVGNFRNQGCMRNTIQGM